MSTDNWSKLNDEAQRLWAYEQLSKRKLTNASRSDFLAFDKKESQDFIKSCFEKSKETDGGRYHITAIKSAWRQHKVGKVDKVTVAQQTKLEIIALAKQQKMTQTDYLASIISGELQLIKEEKKKEKQEKNALAKMNKKEKVNHELFNSKANLAKAHKTIKDLSKQIIVLKETIKEYEALIENETTPDESK